MATLSIVEFRIPNDEKLSYEGGRSCRGVQPSFARGFYTGSRRSPAIVVDQTGIDAAGGREASDAPVGTESLRGWAIEPSEDVLPS